MPIHSKKIIAVDKIQRINLGIFRPLYIFMITGTKIIAIILQS
jgi:hypothetical protein